MVIFQFARLVYQRVDGFRWISMDTAFSDGRGSAGCGGMRFTIFFQGTAAIFAALGDLRHPEFGKTSGSHQSAEIYGGELLEWEH